MSTIRTLVKITLFIVGTVLLMTGAVVFFITQPVVTLGSSPPLPSASVERLRGHVNMLSRELQHRDYRHPEELDKAAEYIRAELTNSGAQVTEQPYQISKGRTFKNMRAFIGSGNKRRVVVGAHYDTFGPLPGSDDNASGVAALLEIPRLLQGANLKHSVELVAYCTEEPPFFGTDEMGSAYHSMQLKRDGVGVIAMIAVESIGYFSDEPDSQTFPLEFLKWIYPTKANFIAVVGGFKEWQLVRKIKRAMLIHSKVTVRSMNAPATITGVDWSDHRNYWSQGYPAVMITGTALNRNEAYHSSQDTPDRLDYTRLAEVTQGIAGAVLELASEAH